MRKLLNWLWNPTKPFCLKKRGFATLLRVRRINQREITEFIMGKTQVIIIDVFPYELENRGESYLVNPVIKRLLNLLIFFKDEMMLFWFESLEEMEILLDWDLIDFQGENKLIMVLIG